MAQSTKTNYRKSKNHNANTRKQSAKERRENPKRYYDRKVKWIANNPDKIKAIRKKWRESVKRQVFEAYGGARCYCCGESEFHFLTIEHLNNDGGAHRKKHANNQMYYVHLRREGYPQDLNLVVACFNCNCGRKANGGGLCPHQEKEGNFESKDTDIRPVEGASENEQIP